MSLYEPVQRWCVPSNLLPESIATMAPDGRIGNEGMVLWLGRLGNKEATITHLVTLPDRWITKRPDYLQVAPVALSALLDYADPHGVSLIGQIHSHPGTFVDLSLPDRRYGISAPYYLSVVAPHYAQRPNTTWNDCGIHQYIPDLGFRRLLSHEVRERITVLSHTQAERVQLGDK